MTTTEYKIEEAAKTNKLLRELLRTDWKTYPVNIIQVDDSIHSGLMPIVLERNNIGR